MVWSATVGARSLDQLASGLGHGLSAHSDRLHWHDLDNNDGDLDIRGARFTMFFFLSCRPKYLPVVSRFPTEFWAVRTHAKSIMDTLV